MKAALSIVLILASLCLFGENVADGSHQGATSASPSQPVISNANPTEMSALPPSDPSAVMSRYMAQMYEETLRAIQESDLPKEEKISRINQISKDRQEYLDLELKEYNLETQKRIIITTIPLIVANLPTPGCLAGPVGMAIGAVQGAVDAWATGYLERKSGTEIAKDMVVGALIGAFAPPLIQKGGKVVLRPIMKALTKSGVELRIAQKAYNALNDEILTKIAENKKNGGMIKSIENEVKSLEKKIKDLKWKRRNGDPIDENILADLMEKLREKRDSLTSLKNLVKETNKQISKKQQELKKLLDDLLDKRKAFNKAFNDFIAKQEDDNISYVRDFIVGNLLNGLVDISDAEEWWKNYIEGWKIILDKILSDNDGDVDWATVVSDEQLEGLVNYCQVQLDKDSDQDQKQQDDNGGQCPVDGKDKYPHSENDEDMGGGGNGPRNQGGNTENQCPANTDKDPKSTEEGNGENQCPANENGEQTTEDNSNGKIDWNKILQEYFPEYDPDNPNPSPEPPTPNPPNPNADPSNPNTSSNPTDPNAPSTDLPGGEQGPGSNAGGTKVDPLSPTYDPWGEVFDSIPEEVGDVCEKVLSAAEGYAGKQLDKLIAKYPGLQNVLNHLGIDGTGIVRGVVNIIGVLVTSPDLGTALGRLTDMALNSLKQIAVRLIQWGVQWLAQKLFGNMLIPQVVKWVENAVSGWAVGMATPIIDTGLQALRTQIEKCAKRAGLKINPSAPTQTTTKFVEELISNGKKNQQSGTSVFGK